jgi:hypothetical protein
MRFFLSLCFLLLFEQLNAAYLLIPMDNSQKNHLKSYGLTYWVLENGVEVDWLLNYRGGSFMFKHHKSLEQECVLRNISYEIIADGQSTVILEEIAGLDNNMDVAKLTKAPKIAVYAPPTTQPWDDAVTLVLTYAEIPYDLIYDEEVLSDILPTYDWLHLHHEDFTGQYGKFWANYRNTTWYQEEVRSQEETARKYGYKKVSQLKLAVAKKLRDFIAGGGYLFAMCSAPDSFDVSLAADGVDICETPFDGDGMDPAANKKLNYDNCIAFTDFSVVKNPYEYEISNIDATNGRNVIEKDDFFVLFEFSAKWDPIPTMLCQNHEHIIRGFMGQSTAFNKNFIKSSVLIMGENKALNEARYIHGEYRKGFFTFYGGHDPEDYRHYVYDPQTDLNLHPNSPGYRLILNNVLFPAAKKKKQKT